MNKKRVLILGASGFVGKNIFDRLSQRKDLEVIGAYHTNRYGRCHVIGNHRLVKIDLTDKSEVRQFVKNVDLIIQAAAVTSGIKDTVERPYIHVTDNVIMNALVFESAYLNHVPQVIFFGTSIVYSPHANRPLTEIDIDLNAGFVSKYFGASWTKTYIEKLGQFYAKLGRTKYTVVRPANLYGPDDRFDLERSHVLAAIITKVLITKDEKITLWGNGWEKKDLLYISDLVDLVEIIMENPMNNFEIFNAGSEKLISIRELAEKIIAIAGQPLNIVWDQTAPTISSAILLNSGKAYCQLGWKSKISLDKGLQKTIAWFRLNQVEGKDGH